MKVSVKSTLCLFVVNASLGILLEAAIVQSARNTRSTEVLAQRGAFKAHKSDRLISPLCVENENRPKIFRQKTAVGCVGESLIPTDKAFLVEFQDKESSNDPNICWKTCDAVYPNTSLAMVFWEEGKNSKRRNGGLDCYCGMADSLFSRMLGPNTFCKNVCDDKYMGTSNNNQTGLLCGGSHQFQELGDTKELYFSIYCLITGSNSSIPDPGPWPPRPEPPIPTEPTIPPGTPSTTPGTDTTTNSPTTETPGNGDGNTHDVDKMLRSIWYSMVNTNVVSVIIIFLLCLVIILVVIVCTWTWMFLRHLDPVATAEFYRQISRRKRNGPKTPILDDNSSAKPSGNGINNSLPGARNAENESGYGTTNRAFDPDCENDPDALKAVHPDNIFTVASGTPSKEGWTTQKVSPPSEYLLKEGKSKFYQRSTDDLDKMTDDEDDFDDPKTIETDAISQTSVETAATLPIKDAIDQDP